jgi:hypothetical protein
MCESEYRHLSLRLAACSAFFFLYDASSSLSPRAHKAVEVKHVSTREFAAVAYFSLFATAACLDDVFTSPVSQPENLNNPLPSPKTQLQCNPTTRCGVFEVPQRELQLRSSRAFTVILFADLLIFAALVSAHPH